MSLTPQVLFDVRQYLAGADLTGYSNKVSLKGMVDDLDMTTFGSQGSKERTGGLSDSSADIEGFWEAGDLSKPDDVFWASLGVSTVPYTAVPTAGTVGSLAYLTRVLECEYAPGGDPGKLLGYTASLKGNWPLLRGQIMHPQGTARTTTGTGTAVQLGAVTSVQRMYACLHVLSVAGTSPSVTVKLQSAATSGGSYTDRITFTAATGLGGQASSVLGAVTDTWWRASWTISGTTPSFLFAVSAGIGPKS